MAKAKRLFEHSQDFSHANLISLTVTLRNNILASVAVPCPDCDRDGWLRAQGVRMTIESDLDCLETVLFSRAVLALKDDLALEPFTTNEES